MSFLSFLLLAAVAYLVWRITDQLPDLIFRISEIQRDVAELRRTLTDTSAPSAMSTSAASRRGDPANTSVEPSPKPPVTPAADSVS